MFHLTWYPLKITKNKQKLSRMTSEQSIVLRRRSVIFQQCFCFSSIVVSRLCQQLQSHPTSLWRLIKVPKYRKPPITSNWFKLSCLLLNRKVTSTYKKWNCQNQFNKESLLLNSTSLSLSQCQSKGYLLHHCHQHRTQVNQSLATNRKR